MVQERLRLFVSAVWRSEVGGRDQRQCTVRLLQGILHAGHEVVARLEVLGLDDHGVSSVFELPGDPLGPGPVGAGVADEEVRRLGHPPPSAHNRLSRHRSTTTGKAAGDPTGLLPANRRANERQSNGYG
jgi:hypothetical protein